MIELYDGLNFDKARNAICPRAFLKVGFAKVVLKIPFLKKSENVVAQRIDPKFKKLFFLFKCVTSLKVIQGLVYRH